MFEATAGDWDLAASLDSDTIDAVTNQMNSICCEAWTMAEGDLRDASDLVDGESKIDRLSNIGTDIYLEITDRFSHSDQILFAGGENPRAYMYLKSQIQRLIAERFEIDKGQIVIGVSNGHR
jgi:hypothetical protein